MPEAGIICSGPSIFSSYSCAKTQKKAIYYDSPLEILDEILDKKPQIIAFGELHPEWGYNYKSAKAIFAEKVLPKLSKAGIKDLVVEQILNDPVIEAELEIFYETGTLDDENTPWLCHTLRVSDEEDLIKLLMAARALGIRVHGGGMTIEQAKETILQDDFQDRKDLKKKAAEYIKSSTLAKALELKKQGRRAAIFSGLKHNDICPSKADLEQGLNFGKELKKELGKDYYEIDLVLPYRKTAVDVHLGIKCWQNIVPEKGVNLLKKGNTYLIFFPKSN